MSVAPTNAPVMPIQKTNAQAEGLKPVAESATGIRHRWLRVVLVLALVLAAFIRWRLLDMPLERDEGEFAYAAQLMLDGVSPYKGAYNTGLKLPGTTVAYAGIMKALGETASAIHAGVLIVTLATALLVFLVARRIAGETAAAVAAATYALLSIQPSMLGLAAHANHFVMLPALAGLLLLMNSNGSATWIRVFFGGLLLGAGVMMKQTGVAFALFGAVWLARQELAGPQRNWRKVVLRMLCLTLGVIIPFAATCLLIVRAGDWDSFYLWTFRYASEHGSLMTIPQSVRVFRMVGADILAGAPGLWLFVVLGLIAATVQSRWSKERFFLLGFAAFSFLAACPGLIFRPHYFLQLLPAAGLLAGVAVESAVDFLRRRRFPLPPVLLVNVVFGAAAASTLIQSSAVYFRLTPVQVSRVIYGANPFPEAVEVARYLKRHAAPDARVAVMGSEPQIFFYSHLRSATGFICTYPLMEPQPYAETMQKNMISEIEAADPDYLVFVHVDISWLPYPNSLPLLQDWLAQYRKDHFEIVGLADMISEDRTDYSWTIPGQPVPAPGTDLWIGIYRNLRLASHPVQ